VAEDCNGYLELDWRRAGREGGGVAIETVIISSIRVFLTELMATLSGCFCMATLFGAYSFRKPLQLPHSYFHLARLP